MEDQSGREEVSDRVERDVKFLKEEGGGSAMILMLRRDGSYSLVSMLGEPSKEQLEFVEDLLVLERASFLLRFVMWVERLFLRIDNWWSG